MFALAPRQRGEGKGEGSVVRSLLFQAACFIIAPLMTTPCVAYRHRATRSRRASATMPIRRIRPRYKPERGYKRERGYNRAEGRYGAGVTLTTKSICWASIACLAAATKRRASPWGGSAQSRR